MTLPHFSIRDVQYSIQLTGYIIVVTTDVPAHLWMRWTIEEIRKHFDPVIKRGASFPVKVRFCVVEYRDNEQAEAGDTLTHTFIKLNWPECQTRRFYFFGRVAGVWSPSESPLFEKHFMLPLMNGPFYAQIDAFPWTKWTRRMASGASYLATHADPDATSIGNANTRFCDQSKLGTNYFLIDRKPLYFDTSVIPSDAFVYGAIMTQYVDYVAGRIKDIHLFDAPDLHNPPVLSDYGYMRTLTTNPIGKLLAGWIIHPNTKWWKINPAGIASINRTGVTKWALRTIDDVNASQPGDTVEGIYLYSEAEHLIVTYYLPS